MRTSKKDGYSFQCKMYNKNLALKIYMEYFYTVKKKKKEVRVIVYDQN